jgi:hypothetical protein
MTIMNQVARINANIETATKAGEFVACAKSLLAARGRANDAAAFAEQSGYSDRVTRVLKTGVAAGNSSTTGWAQELISYQAVADSFLASLAPYSSFDKIINLNGFTRLPMETRIFVASTAAVGSAVSEGSLKPVTQMQFDASNFEPKKAIAIVVVIPRSRHNPKILWVDDAEIVGDRIT